MPTNKNTLDQPGVTKRVRTAYGVLVQSVPVKLTKIARTAAQHEKK